MSISFGTYSMSLAYLLSILLLYSCFYTLHIPILLIFHISHRSIRLILLLSYHILSYVFTYVSFVFICYNFHIPFSFIYFLYFTCSYPFRVLYFVLSIYCIHVLFMYYFHIPIFMYCSFHILFSCYTFHMIVIYCAFHLILSYTILSYDIHILCFSYTVLFICFSYTCHVFIFQSCHMSFQCSYSLSGYISCLYSISFSSFGSMIYCILHFHTCTLIYFPVICVHLVLFMSCYPVLFIYFIYICTFLFYLSYTLCFGILSVLWRYP